MASIFTFDPEPPRVASPWLHGTSEDFTSGPPSSDRQIGGVKISYSDAKKPLLTRLEAEPQEGPTEYKLHLLLRSRRTFVKSTTGGLLHRHGHLATPGLGDLARSNSEDALGQASPPQSSSTVSRQSRLQQLTTQLLWRLQQSAPNHSSSYSAAIIPRFSDLEKGNSSPRIQPIIPGLEESQGALYEVGVADDGALIGLCEDEMDESISNLRIMAASLGCVVSVLRMLPVGHCEWLDDEGELHKDVLWVSEAYVKPSLAHDDVEGWGSTVTDNDVAQSAVYSSGTGREQESTEQLRISLTGATMSGKSSLLGSLTTATMDNGRGKSRLSLLKHRHEIATGMTSSVTQELIGYNKVVGFTNEPEVRIVNYAFGHVSSWIDIHGLSKSGRLCLLSDSAGHLRYRRTTMRGLIGWAPHWTFLCVPADNFEDTSGMTGSTPPPQEVLGVSDVDIDLSEANLELCLRLDLPLVIIVTKLDLASRSGLRSCLAKVLSTLKRAGRRPVILSDNPADGIARDQVVIPPGDIKAVGDVIAPLHQDPLCVVPIIMSSAVNGMGISKIHALLHALPRGMSPSVPSSPVQDPGKLFHVEDIYAGKTFNVSMDQQPIVLSGYVQSGSISIGEILSLGPFSVDTHLDSDEAINGNDRPQMPTSRSFPGALPHLARFNQSTCGTGNDIEWRQAKVVSLRNLRLPVRTLLADQVGTIGVVLIKEGTRINSNEPVVRVRKGMILASGKLQACTSFEADFERADVETLSIRSSVVVYTASVRASARVVAGAVHSTDDEEDDTNNLAEDLDSLLLEDNDLHEGKLNVHHSNSTHRLSDQHSNTQHRPLPRIVVTFQFIASREFLQVGSKVMVMPGGGPGLFGGLERGAKGMARLEGFVGTILRVST